MLRLLFYSGDQPAPTPATGDAWLDLLSDFHHLPAALRAACVARRDLGIERYGTPLQRDNGRDHLRDLLEELLDAAVYAHVGGRIDVRDRVMAIAAELMAEGGQ